jgi:transposase
MVFLLESGFAQQTDVARAFFRSERTVRRYQRRYAQGGMAALDREEGWRRGRRRISGKRLRSIEMLKSQGMSNRAIAHRLGVSEKAIRKLVGPSKPTDSAQLAFVGITTAARRRPSDAGDHESMGPARHRGRLPHVRALATGRSSRKQIALGRPSSSARRRMNRRSLMRRHRPLRLIGNHLDDVGQVLSFGCELDDGPLVEVSDFDALGNAAALLEELRHASTGCAQLLAEPAMGDLEAPHGRPAPFGAALGIGDGAGRVLRLDLVIDERIEQELLSLVLDAPVASCISPWLRSARPIERMPPRPSARCSTKRRQSSPALTCEFGSQCVRHRVSGLLSPARRSSAALPRPSPRLPDRRRTGHFCAMLRRSEISLYAPGSGCLLTAARRVDHRRGTLNGCREGGSQFCTWQACTWTAGPGPC